MQYTDDDIHEAFDEMRLTTNNSKILKGDAEKEFMNRQLTYIEEYLLQVLKTGELKKQISEIEGEKD